VTEPGVGDRFQEQTKYRRDHLPGRQLDWARRPQPYKHYPSAPKVALPPPQIGDGVPIWQVVRERRSVRRFSAESLSSGELSQLLWASQGITRTGRGVSFRTVPSAGALYPVETYLALHSVEGIEPGIYHYAVDSHELDLLREGEFRTEVARAALDQGMAYAASVVFIWTAIFERSRWKYGQRAYRYVYLDAGHLAQNLALAAVALGLGSCQIAALYDEEANELLGVDGHEESAIYMTVVGKPKQR